MRYSAPPMPRLFYFIHVIVLDKGIYDLRIYERERESGREREKVSFEVRIIAVVSHSSVLRYSAVHPSVHLLELGNAKLAYR